jgi:hypothetical protein
MQNQLQLFDLNCLGKEICLIIDEMSITMLVEDCMFDQMITALLINKNEHNFQYSITVSLHHQDKNNINLHHNINHIWKQNQI